MKLANSDWHAYTQFQGPGSRSYPRRWALALFVILNVTFQLRQQSRILPGSSYHASNATTGLAGWFGHSSAAEEEEKEDVTVPSEEAPTQVAKGLAYDWPITRNMTDALCEGQESIDRLHVPTLIIAGAQKGGTSALYKLLGMHPHVIRSKKFEPHFFDWKLGGNLYRQDPANVSDAVICERRRTYQQNFDLAKVQRHHQSGSDVKIATFEKTWVPLDRGR